MDNIPKGFTDDGEEMGCCRSAEEPLEPTED